MTKKTLTAVISKWVPRTFLFSILFFNAVSTNAQIDFSPIIKDVLNGFEGVETYPIMLEEEPLVYRHSPYQIDGVDEIFHTVNTKNDLKNVTLGINHLNFSKDQVLSDLKKTANVTLSAVENDIQLLEKETYLIQKNDLTVGYLEVYQIDKYFAYEFFHFPAHEIKEGLDKIISILLEDNIDQYKGANIPNKNNFFTSTYLPPRSIQSLLLHKEKFTSFYIKYPVTRRYVWLTAFGEELELLASNTLIVTKSSPIKTRESDQVKTKSFEAVKSGQTFAIEVWDDFSILIVKNSNKKKLSEDMVENETVKNQILSGLREWNSSTSLINDFGDIMDQALDMSNAGNMSDAQVKMNSAKWKLSNFRASGLFEMSESLDRAIEEAELMNCHETKKYLLDFYDPIKKTFSLAANLEESLDDFIHSRSNTAQKGNLMVGFYNDLIDNLRIVNSNILQIKDHFPSCIVPKTAVKTSKLGTTYYELEESYDAPEVFIPHSGVYEGIGLVDLLGRHLEDPAVQNFLKDTNSKETFKSSNGYYSYDGDHLTINFYKKRLTHIDIGNALIWPYKIPKSHIDNIKASTLDFDYTGKPYLMASKNNIDFMVYYNEDSKKIESLSINTTAKNLREKWDEDALQVATATNKQVNNSTLSKEEEEELRKEQIWNNYGIKAKCYYDFSSFKIAPLHAKTKLEVNRHYTLVSLNGKEFKGAYPGELKQILDNGTYPLKAKLISYGDKIIPFLIHKKPDGSLEFTKDFSAQDAKPVGIGASIGKGKEVGTYKVSFLSSTSAAYLGGMRKGDLLLTIGGQNTSGKELSEVKQLLKGNRGSTVAVVVKRSEKTLEFIIKRK